MSTDTTSNSRFGALAIARVESSKDDEMRLTVIDRGPFDTKNEAIEKIHERLENDEADNRLVLTRLNGFFEAKTETVVVKEERRTVFEVDEEGEALEGEDKEEPKQEELTAAAE